MADPRETMDQTIDRERGALAALALRLHAEPELAFNEHKAAGWIAETLTARGFSVERPFGGLPTAFRARLGDGSAPHVAILAEYDALPEIGHACGHNLIAAGAVGAFLALGAAARPAGTVDLIGTPAEEGGGGKIKLLQAGAFAGIEAAMMFHPLDRDLLMHPTLATLWLDMSFAGRASHAALAPHEGKSALTACMDTFRLIDGQRVHLKDGVRVHGFIKEGGEAVNIIPERARCQFSVRAPTLEGLAVVRAVVERCARGAAIASDVEVTIEARQGYIDMRNNEPMALRFGEHMRALGRDPRTVDPDIGTGSTDMGDVSHAVPSIHPWVAICGKGDALCHQHAFAAHAASERGITGMVAAAKAMARTAYDLLEDERLRRDVKTAFDQR